MSRELSEELTLSTVSCANGTETSLKLWHVQHRCDQRAASMAAGRCEDLSWGEDVERHETAPAPHIALIEADAAFRMTWPGAYAAVLLQPRAGERLLMPAGSTTDGRHIGLRLQL